MLGEIRKNMRGDGVREVSEELATTKANQQEQIDKLSKEIEVNKQSFSQLQNEVMQMLSMVEQANNSTTKLQNNLEEAMTDVKLVSSTIQNTLVTRISDDLSDLRRTVEEKLGGSEALKKEVEASTKDIQKQFADLQKELAKLTTITTKIKATDFEMNKVANHLIKEDKEKLRLMNEVDRLQRLVGSLRRKR